MIGVEPENLHFQQVPGPCLKTSGETWDHLRSASFDLSLQPLEDSDLERELSGSMRMVLSPSQQPMWWQHGLQDPFLNCLLCCEHHFSPFQDGGQAFGPILGSCWFPRPSRRVAGPRRVTIWAQESSRGARRLAGVSL
jgi:hypothetical protein